MRLPLRRLALVAALLSAAPAGASTLVGMVADPSQSSLTPSGGSPGSLSGSLDFAVGSLPFGPGNTTFDLVGLALAASGGTIGLDPDVASPGLGVLKPTGELLIPTLFLTLSNGVTSVPLALPDVTGTVSFGPGGASITGLETSFGVLTPTGPVDVHLVARVPEPATALLTALGLVALARRARRHPSEVSR